METAEARAYLAAAETFAELVGRIDGGRWTEPGLGEWDLRSLVGHTSRSLATVLTYFAQSGDAVELDSAEDYYVAVGRMTLDPDEVTERGRQAGVQLGNEPAAAVRRLVNEVRAVVGATDPDRVIPTIAGGMRANSYLPTRTFELVVHGLDIARATGLDVRFEPDVLNDAAQLAARICVATGQAPALLAAMTGRAPLPAGFSLVP